MTKIILLVLINLVTPKARAKHEAFVQQTGLRGEFVEHLSQTLVAQQSVTKIILLVLINLVTPKARAKHEAFVEQTGLRPVDFCLNLISVLT